MIIIWNNYKEKFEVLHLAQRTVGLALSLQIIIFMGIDLPPVTASAEHLPTVYTQSARCS